MRLIDRLELETNITLTLRYPDGRVKEQRSHNLWLDYGRAWLLKLMSYAAGGPGFPMEDNRICGMQLGIGGNEQNATIPTDVDTDYPGTNVQDDETVTVTQLERPVRVDATPTWVKLIDHAYTAAHINIIPGAGAPPYYVQYKCSFGPTDITYAPYYVVPLSEIGLFEYSRCQAPYLNAAYGTIYPAPGTNRPEPVSYDTFPSLSKTFGVTLDAVWEIRLPG